MLKQLHITAIYIKSICSICFSQLSANDSVYTKKLKHFCILSSTCGGKVLLCHKKLTFTRIIPACAGKSSIVSCIFLSRRDHPRLRGEKTHSNAFYISCQKSSPLARGKDRTAGFIACFKRIIPACAGKSLRKGRNRNGLKDHPRLRGEKFAKIDILVYQMGSSPLARGKGCIYVCFGQRSRIIPACAGKSASCMNNLFPA